MGIPKGYLKDADAMPAALRALLDAELAAGNEIAEVGHSFPAPPVGAFFRLARPVTTRAGESGGGIVFYDRNTSIYSGEFTDSRRFFFILEPPHPQEPEPDMDAIRAAHESAQPAAPTPEWASRAEAPERVPGAGEAAADTPLRRFERSLVMDYEKWHDGIGYDLDALRAASPAERDAIETMLARRRPRDWRDIEALAALATPAALEALHGAMRDADPQVRAAVTRYAPELVSDAERTASLVRALETAAFFGGLTQTLDDVAEFHPPDVIEALLRGALSREGEAAVHFAAMLYFLHGKASEPFDMAQRPFFLRFNTSHRGEREAAFRELCQAIGVRAEKYLAP